MFVLYLLELAISNQMHHVQASVFLAKVLNLSVNTYNCNFFLIFIIAGHPNRYRLLKRGHRHLKPPHFRLKTQLFLSPTKPLLTTFPFLRIRHQN